MKILKEDNERIVCCDKCKTKIQYEKEDLEYGEYGYPYIECPICGEKIDLSDKEEDLKLDFDNIEYPTHFSHLGKTSNAKILNNDIINDTIKKLSTKIRTDEEPYYYMSCYGNTLILITDNVDEYNIYVCPNYSYSTVFKDNSEKKSEIKNQILNDKEEKKLLAELSDKFEKCTDYSDLFDIFFKK